MEFRGGQQLLRQRQGFREVERQLGLGIQHEGLVQNTCCETRIAQNRLPEAGGQVLNAQFTSFDREAAIDIPDEDVLGREVDADAFERGFELQTIEAQQLRRRIGMAADSKCGNCSTANFERRLRDPGIFRRDFPGGGHKFVEIDTHRLAFQCISTAFVARQFSAQHQVW